MRDLPHTTQIRMAAYRRLAPVAVLAFLGSWAVHWTVGSDIAVDAWLLPTMALLWLTCWLLAERRVLSVSTFEIVILVSLAAFFLVKMTYVAWIATDPNWYDVLEFSLYLPGFFAMSYWTSPRRRAWLMSWLFLAMFMLVASPYLLEALLSGTTAGVGTAVVFLHLALMSALVVEFLRAYGDTVFAQRLEVDRAERLASIDELTDLANRRALERHLRILAEEMERGGPRFSVILADLDRFKRVNDTYGHNVGDEVLCRLAQLLRDGVRGHDRVGRWGGEEFAIVCAATPLDAAAELADRVRRKISSAKFPHDSELTASFGVAEARPGEPVGDLVARADAALYEAKRGGRDRVRVHAEQATPAEPARA